MMEHLLWSKDYWVFAGIWAECNFFIILRNCVVYIIIINDCVLYIMIIINDLFWTF
jgi:hypothetical protein